MPQQRRAMADRTRTSRQGRQVQRGVRGGRVRKSRSGDRSTIAAPRPASLTAESTVSRTRGAMQGLTPSRPQIAEPAPADDGQQLADDGQQLADDGHQSADDSIDSDDGEYEDNDGQSEVSEEEENGENGEDDEDVLEPGADDEDLSADWGAQRPVENEFLSSQPSIITITPGHTQTSGGRVSYQERRTPAPIRVSQNRTPAFLPRLPAALNPLATPVLTQTQSDPTMREFDNGSGQRTSTRRNVAVGLERSILVKARDLMWDWTIFVNPFPDPITLTEVVPRCWKDARSELGFPNFADAALPSTEQVRYP